VPCRSVGEALLPRSGNWARQECLAYPNKGSRGHAPRPPLKAPHENEAPLMSFRTTYILFGLLAVMLIAMAVALLVGPPAEPSIYVLPVFQDKNHGARVEDVDLVSIERSGGNKLVLRRGEGGRWTVNGYRADSGAVRMLLNQLSEAKRIKTDQPAKLADWGL